MAQSHIIYPLCAECSEPITDKIVQAIGQTFHEDHFLCAHCKQPIKEPVFAVKKGQPYCKADYTKLFSKICSACGEKIRNVALIAKDSFWHQGCFICTGCRRPLKEGFYEKNNNHFCKDCFTSRFSSKCKECDKSIKGEASIAMGKKFHPDCFRCNVCQSKITNTFKLVKNLPICVRCSITNQSGFPADIKNQIQPDVSVISKNSLVDIPLSNSPSGTQSEKAPSPDIPPSSLIPALSVNVLQHETPEILPKQSNSSKKPDGIQEIQEPPETLEPSIPLNPEEDQETEK